jgi:hypothetical protein
MRRALLVLVLGAPACASQPTGDAAPAGEVHAPAAAPPVVDPPPEPKPDPAPKPEPEPAPIGCWERTFGAPPAAEGMGPSLAEPIAGCEGCETLRAGPHASSLHPEVLRRLLAVQRTRPAPEIDEPVLWVNSGRRAGNPSKSMHNQGLAVDMVVCGLDSPATAALLRDAGFTCVIEYYGPDGTPCHMAHADMRGTESATAAYAPGGRKATTCPMRAVSRGADCQGSSKEDWSYDASGAG